VTIPSSPRGFSLLVPALFPGILLVSALSCSDPCKSWKARVEGTLNDARRSQASLYAPAAFSRAMELAAKAERECRVQRSRFLLSRSYEVTERLYASAASEGLNAVREAGMNRGVARQEALNARYSAGAAVDEARIALLRATQAAGDPAAHAFLERLERLRQALGKLQERIDGADYLAAREIGLRIREEAIRLEADADRRVLAPRAK
jgi:hypothetical protein